MLNWKLYKSIKIKKLIALYSSNTESNKWEFAKQENRKWKMETIKQGNAENIYTTRWNMSLI